MQIFDFEGVGTPPPELFKGPLYLVKGNTMTVKGLEKS